MKTGKSRGRQEQRAEVAAARPNWSTPIYPDAALGEPVGGGAAHRPWKANTAADVKASECAHPYDGICPPLLEWLQSFEQGWH